MTKASSLIIICFSTDWATIGVTVNDFFREKDGWSVWRESLDVIWTPCVVNSMRNIKHHWTSQILFILFLYVSSSRQHKPRWVSQTQEGARYPVENARVWAVSRFEDCGGVFQKSPSDMFSAKCTPSTGRTYVRYTPLTYFFWAVKSCSIFFKQFCLDLDERNPMLIMHVDGLVLYRSSNDETEIVTATSDFFRGPAENTTFLTALL